MTFCFPIHRKGNSIPHYNTYSYTPNNTYLDDENYGKALDTFVKACVDAVILRKETLNEDVQWSMLLGKRNIHPHRDWWTFGGRMKAGETPSDCLMRNIKRDLSINESDIDSIEFITLGSFAWGYREQPPQYNGSCDIILFYAIELKNQAKEFVVTPLEYDEIKWVPIDDILSADEHKYQYHPAIFELAKNIKTHYKK